MLTKGQPYLKLPYLVMYRYSIYSIFTLVYKACIMDSVLKCTKINIFMEKIPNFLEKGHSSDSTISGEADIPPNEILDTAICSTHPPQYWLLLHTELPLRIIRINHYSPNISDSSVKITNRSFRYATPHLRDKLSPTVRHHHPALLHRYALIYQL